MSDDSDAIDQALHQFAGKPISDDVHAFAKLADFYYRRRSALADRVMVCDLALICINVFSLTNAAWVILIASLPGEMPVRAVLIAMAAALAIPTLTFVVLRRRREALRQYEKFTQGEGAR